MNGYDGIQTQQARSVGAITGSIGHLEKAMACLLSQIERAESHLESSGLLRPVPGVPLGSEKAGPPTPTPDSALSCNIRAQAHRAEAMERRLGALFDRLDV